MGFTSLFGAVFVICHETGKVIDFRVLSKFCKGCSHWEKKDKESVKYQNWKKQHVKQCDVNFSGSSGAMEPRGTLNMFQSSLEYNLRYKYLIADGDSKTRALLLEEQPYGKDHLVEKTVGYIKKRMGTALRNLKKQYRGQKLSDGKIIGGRGRLTGSLEHKLILYKIIMVSLSRAVLVISKL